MSILTGIYEYYYVVLILQGLCVWHSIRRGTQGKWLWIIVFLPLVGSIAYLFSEVIKKRDVSSIQDNVSNLVNPSGTIKKLEKKYQFANTFANRVALADAYLTNGMHEKAIELYEISLTGLFQDNEHVIKNLIQAYFHFGRFEDIVNLAPKISKSIDFSKSPANLAYAIALEKVGKDALAEQEYKNMKHRFSNFEQRYAYGDFLLRKNRKEEAVAVFNEVIDEAQFLNRREIGGSRIWIEKTQQQLNKIMTEV